VDQALPLVNAGARWGGSRLGLRPARGKIVEGESYIVAVEIDLEHPVDRFAKGGKFVERGFFPGNIVSAGSSPRGRFRLRGHLSPQELSHAC
jgi:hypothetical protein